MGYDEQFKPKKQERLLAMEQKTNLDWALTYAKHGFSVLPLIPNTKHPVFKHADMPPLTTEQIKKYWSENPNYGIAIKMTNIFSIDIDTPQHSGTTKVDGYKSFEENIPKEWLTPTLVASTPSKGMHYYYLKKDGFPNKPVEGILKGVDIQAHKNNYSVVPPTIINGKSYKWLNHRPIATPTDELINFLKEKIQVNKKGNVCNKNSFNSSSDIQPTWTGNLINMLCYPQIKGKRNDYLTCLVGTLLSTHAEPENCYELAIFANEHFQEPLSDKELNKTFNSILRSEIAKYEK